MNSTSVSVAEIPTVIRTFVSHYINKKNAEKPTSHLRYDQGLNLVRSFIDYSSTHTVEELQSFTSQWVPHPTWVRVQRVTIPSSILDKAAVYLQAELGEAGLAQVGGQNWWQWRLPGSTLDAEWVEMKSDHQEKLESETEDNKNTYRPRRVMFYLHGGAYYFGGVNEHRYQLQRHARKLKARVFAPEYRLAPQFPFPCGLQDALAAYMSLLVSYDPKEIIFAGDSAGGALVLSLMVVLRNQNLPLPSGAILLSPWVDLTHSFPSLSTDSGLDYVPTDGFHHKPSKAWPPPTYEEWVDMCNEANSSAAMEYAKGVKRDQTAPTSDPAGAESDPSYLRATVDGEEVVVKDQVQMYAPNHLLSHPLVSPIMQATLGGLPPVMIVTGGAELLRDEQVFIAHKLANPQKYAAPNLSEAQLAQLAQYPPTLVQLQVWDHLCHVATTLSFTEPAKYMFRSIAQFGAWALNVRPDVAGLAEDSSDMPGSSSSTYEASVVDRNGDNIKPIGNIGAAGDPLPEFVDSMIRQRVTQTGEIYDLAPASSFPYCDPPDYTQVGKVKVRPLKMWLGTRARYDAKYARVKREIRREIIEDIRGGFIKHGDGETPPLSALAGRYLLNPVPRKSKLSKITAPHAWSIWGSKHDDSLMQFRRKQEEDHEAEEQERHRRLMASRESTGPQSPVSTVSSTAGVAEVASGNTTVLMEVETTNEKMLESLQSHDISKDVSQVLQKPERRMSSEEPPEPSVLSSTQSSRASSDISSSSVGQTRGEKFYEAQEGIASDDNGAPQEDVQQPMPKDSEPGPVEAPPLPPRPVPKERVSEKEAPPLEAPNSTTNSSPFPQEQPKLKTANIPPANPADKTVWIPPETPLRVRPAISTTNLPSLDPLSPISPLSVPFNRELPSIPRQISAKVFPERLVDPSPEIPKAAQTAKSIRSVKSTKSTHSVNSKTPKSPQSFKSLNRISPSGEILMAYSTPTMAPPQKELPKLPPGQLPKITIPRTQLPTPVNLNPWEASAPPTSALPPLPPMARAPSERKGSTSHDLELFPTRVEQPLDEDDDPESVLSLVDSKSPIQVGLRKETFVTGVAEQVTQGPVTPPSNIFATTVSPTQPSKSPLNESTSNAPSSSTNNKLAEPMPSGDASTIHDLEVHSIIPQHPNHPSESLHIPHSEEANEQQDTPASAMEKNEPEVINNTSQPSHNSWDHLVQVSPPPVEKDLPQLEKLEEPLSPQKSMKPERKRRWPWSRISAEKSDNANSSHPANPGTSNKNLSVYPNLSSTSTQQSWTRFPAWRSQVDMLMDQRRSREKEKATKGEIETGVVGKRPMLGGIALPFSLGRKASTESLRTLHSDEDVKPNMAPGSTPS
ncbi:hypothetical protein BROUX41_000655 [Berkeleyomyces rouxiae]|uniref:uncharacterized protein n=1 Tax=Berkeleyomyces rouxiae TaxID=2035830 RepID=UPI003B7B24D5